MNLTGKQLVEQGIITGPVNEDNIQQHGVDLNLIGVSRVVGPGFIPYEGKTKLAKREFVEPVIIDEATVWNLAPGVYDITFAQGCSIPADKRLKIVHRSSLFRNGGQLNSALFDAGFKTDNIGTVMILSEPMIIETNARVGQAFTDESNVVTNLYSGQWQGDNQRLAPVA
jgi:deoxycytidine triphosphate deaminase